jgi:hypothetical protein
MAMPRGDEVNMAKQRLCPNSNYSLEAIMKLQKALENCNPDQLRDMNMVSNQMDNSTSEHSISGKSQRCQDGSENESTNTSLWMKVLNGALLRISNLASGAIWCIFSALKRPDKISRNEKSARGSGTARF